LHLLDQSDQKALEVLPLLLGQDRQQYQLEILLANNRYLNLEFALNERYEKRKKRHCIQQHHQQSKRYLKTKFLDTETRRHKK
tara:strand:+ start:290 stop:538 length:249 start_codon:yes stop_codon:yes gene_type:complete